MAVYGWTLYLYYIFDEQLGALEKRVGIAKKQRPADYPSLPATKLLAKVNELIRERIPIDPTAPQFRPGNTLGKANRQWFRAKFLVRYRLFFRFSTQEKAIVYAGMNDEATLRKRGSKTDPYVMFETMLEAGDPPHTFGDLLARSRAVSEF